MYPLFPGILGVPRLPRRRETDTRAATSNHRRLPNAARLLLGLSICFAAPGLSAQTAADTASIRGIVADEITAWDHDDAVAYSRHVAADLTFTNIRGEFFRGYSGFLHQHAEIFGGIFKHTKLRQDIVSLRFIGPDAAIVEVLTTVSGVKHPPARMTLDKKGHLRTRLLQVVAKQAGDWKIVAYHNVDVKPGVPLPESR